MNQPIVVGTFENVEMERLRFARESANLAREEAAYREQLLLLQQKLARASFSVLPADQIPLPVLNDFRSFLSANAGDVGRSAQYYNLLTETLNDLIPRNPYAEPSNEGQPNVARAEEKLQRLFSFPEDEGISRSIMAQIAAIRGGVFDSDQRRNQLRAEYQALEKRKKDLAWNISVASQPNKLTGAESVGAKSIPMYQEELRQVEERLAELKGEAQTVLPALQTATRELQFQQFVVELAFQRRYVHSLLAAGFYRLYSSNMTVSPEAYPQQQQEAAQNASGPGSGPLVPVFNSVPALETFLMNRISDTRKSRESIDNMLRSRQLSAAENLLRELVLTAKYQPELHTIPYEERQRILTFSETIRKLSDTLATRNYDEIRRLAEEVEEISADPGMADIKAFAEEHPRKAVHWARQAGLAMKAGDRETTRSFMEAAHERAPFDKEVEETLRKLEENLLSGGDLRNELVRLLEAEDHREIHRRRGDFARFAADDADPELREGLESMLQREASVEEALKKSEAFEARSSYPDSWLALSDLPAELARDPRIRERRETAERKCESFVTAYRNAREHEETEHLPLALAWYLTALAEAPSATANLKERIEELGRTLSGD